MTWDKALGPQHHPMADAAESFVHGTYARPPPQDTRPKRPDIQGLRAVAVLVVVLFHAGVTRLAGGFIGVDVFFVISGFLITGNITRQLLSPEGRSFSLAGFYANRARRLLPAAFVTIATTCFLAYKILPYTRLEEVGHDAIASALYAVNWRLASRSVDYLAQAEQPSPFQHFWSLAVEEQFYLVWPLLLLIATLFVLHRSSGVRRVAFGVALAGVLVPSLMYSLSYTASNPSEAYFVTPTRMWELALGGGLAIVGNGVVRIPRILAALIGWAGLAGIAYSAVEFTGGTPFPGSAALVPTLGAVGVIAAGPASGRFGPALLLNLRLPVFVGDISYSLYLWHWPLIVLVSSKYAGPAPLWATLTAGLGAIIPAWLSFRFIEQPGMRAEKFESTRNGLSLGLMATISSATAAMLLLVYIPEAPPQSIIVANNGQARTVTGKTVKVGAQLLGMHPRTSPAAKIVDSFDSIEPPPEDAELDRPADGCVALQQKYGDVSCTFGDKSSSRVVDLVGDSHAMQWEPALATAGKTEHWKVVTHTRQSCPLNTTPVTLLHHAYPECDDWQSKITQILITEKPALVLVSAAVYRITVDGHYLSNEDSTPKLVSGYRNAWHKLTSDGIKVGVLDDTPRPDRSNSDIVGCVAQHRQHLSACAMPRSIIDDTLALAKAGSSTPDVHFIDLNDVICPGTKCAAVIGSVLVYRDGNHVSATYMATMADQVDAAVAAALADT